MILPLVLLATVGQVHQATPLRLHNRIVFTTDNASVAWTMNSDGGERKRVWRVPFGYGQFGGFSCDGEALSFNRFNVYVHDLETKRRRRILVWNGGWGTDIAQPSFSPDGKQIVCEVSDANQNASDSQVLRLEADKSYSVIKGLDAQKLRPVGEGVPPKNM